MNKSLSTPRGQSLYQFAKTLLLPVLLFLWGNVWGQGTFGTPIFSENFGSIANNTDLTSSNTAFTYTRVGTSTTTNSFTNQIKSKNPSSFTASSMMIGAKGGSVSTVDKTGFTSFNSGAYTFKVRTPSSLTATAVLFSAIGNGSSFASNNVATLSQISAGFQLIGSELQIRSNGGWVKVQDITAATNYTIAIIFNNTASSLSYGDSQTLPGNRVHIWVNGVKQGSDYVSATNSYAATAFRIYATTGEFEVDDVTVYNTLPISSATCPAPTSPTAGTITSSAATISWTAPSSAPAGGYDYYYSTTNTAPTGSSTVTNTSSTSATLSLSPNTTYYWWVRSHCNTSDLGSWVSGGSFTTLCNSVTTFPFTETFETASSSRACWTQVQEVGTGNWSYIGGSSGGSITTAQGGGGLNARFVSISGANSPITKLVSPVMDLTSVSNPVLSFWYGQQVYTGDQNQLKVYYRISSSSPWVQIQHYTGSVASWTEISNLSLPSPSSTYQIAFEGINNYGHANVLDNITVKSGPTCSVPVATFSSNVVAHNNVNINWGTPSSAPANGYEYYISTTNTTPVAGVTVTGSVAAGITTANITSGAPTTAYFWWVRSNCGASDKSEWVYGGTYTTPLAPCTTPAVQPTALVFGTTGATAINATFTGVASPNTPSGYIILRSLSETAPTLVNGTTYATSSTQTLGGNPYFVVQGSATASLGTSIANTGLASNTIYYYYVYSFNNACTGQPYYLNTTPLTGSKITCPAPATGATSTVTNAGVSVSWISSAAGGSAETIKYRFELYSDSGRTTPVAGYPLADTVSPVNITTGLTVNTTYYYRIIAYNSSCQSTNLDGSFYNGVCIPGTTSNTSYYITNFTTTKGYTSNISKTSTYVAAGYQDNYATDKVEMYPTGSFDFSYTTAGSQVGTSVWVDWNNDWIFDASERVYTSGAYGTGGNASVTVPAGTAIGDYRIRVRAERQAASPDNPCSVNFAAETEDYKLTVVATPNYVVYTDALAANNTVNNTLNIYLKDFDGFNEFYTNDQLEIWMHAGIKTSIGTWLYQNAGQDFNNTATLIKFTRESTNPNVYKATIKLGDWFCIPTGTTVEGLNLVFRNQYGGGGNNQTGNMVLDLTPAAVVVNAPTLPASSLVTTTTATISWTAPTTGAVKGFDYYYSTSNTAPTSGTTPSGTITGNVTTANLSSLSPATTYYYWIRTKGCDTNSAWTASANFTTACAVSILPILENFDTAVIPNCWTKQFTGVSYLDFVNAGTNPTTSPIGGSGNMVRFNSFAFASNNAQERLITKSLSSSGVSSVSLDFQWRNENNTSYTNLAEGVQIQYSLDGSTWVDVSNAFFARHDGSLVAGSAQWNKKTIILPSAISNQSNFYLAFSFQSRAGDNMFMDSVHVYETPATLYVNNTKDLSLTFADQAIGTTSAAKTFNLSGLMLTGAPGTITVSAPAGFEVSSVDNTTWGASTTVSYSSATLADKQVNVRFKPTDCTPISNATLTISGGGATVIPTVSLSGSGTIPPPTATAATTITDTSFTAHWDAVPGATGYELDVYEKVSTVAPELVTNGSFETGSLSGWSGTNGTFSIATDTPQDGSNYVKKTNTTTNQLEQNITVEIGKSYLFSFWYKDYDATNVNGLRNYTIHGTSGSNYIHSSTPRLPAASTWTKYEMPFTATQTTVRISVRAYQTVSIDNISIRAVDNVETKTYVSGYNSKPITGGSTISDVVTGLTADTQYHYVVRATTGTCKSVNSGEIDVKTSNNVVWDAGAWSNTSGPSATLNAIVRAPFVVGADATQTTFTAKDLTVESTGSVEIPANQGITVVGKITTADNKIIIDSDGSLLQTNSPTVNDNIGQIIAKRGTHMRKMDYTYWATPVTGQKLLNTSGGANSTLYNVGGFSEGTPNNRIYQYNEPNDTFKAATDANFVPAKAYAVRGKDRYLIDFPSNVPVADQFTFTGIANNGTYSVGIQKSKNTTSGTPAVEYTHGYNMIGNPYPSNIDFIKFFNFDHGDGTKNSDHIFGKAWFWTNVPGAPVTQGGSAYTPNNYAVLTLAGGTPATGVKISETTSPSTDIPNEFIKVAQGFIVEMKGTPPIGTTPNTATLKFDNSIRTNNNTGHFYNSKNSQNEINRYWLKLTSPFNIVNTILVAHMDGATNGYDADYDAELLAVGDDSFYSKLNTQKLQIQARSNPLTTEDVIPLGNKYSANGNYKISLGNKEGIFAGDQKIYLLDKLNNLYTDLSVQDYIFTASKGTDDTRFEIVYRNQEVLGTDNLSKSDFSVYRDGTSFVIRSTFSLGKIELYDASGKLVIATSSNQKEFRLDAAAIASGVYIIRAENSGNIRTKKIIK